jgi:hypothetical protein
MLYVVSLNEKIKLAEPSSLVNYCSGLVGSNSQIFTQLGIIEHAYNPILSFILDSDKAGCPIICVLIFGWIA